MFFCVHGWSPLAQEIPTHQYLLRPTHSSFFFLLGRLVSASAGARPLLYGIIRGHVGLSSRVCGGYERRTVRETRRVNDWDHTRRPPQRTQPKTNARGTRQGQPHRGALNKYDVE